MDVHPNPDEIKPYVAVGPTKELSVTVHKSTFDASFIIFTIIFGAALLTLIIVTAYFAYKEASLPPPPPPLEPIRQPTTLHSNVGAISNSSSKSLENDGSDFTTEQSCSHANHTIWTDNQCRCVYPFFGHDCSREYHDNKYYSVGTPNFHLELPNSFASLGKSLINSKLLTDDKSLQNAFRTSAIFFSVGNGIFNVI